MNTQIEKLRLDSVSYREAVDQIFSSPHPRPQDWQRLFGEILICASQLYLDYLLVVRNLSAFDAISSGGDASDHVRVNALREKDLREKLREELASSSCWSRAFKPQNPFSKLTGLCSIQDYFDRLTLHLPEIYEETFRVEAYAKKLLTSHDNSVFNQLMTALRHLGRNHISFVLQALEWVVDEDSWETSLMAS